MKFSKTKKPLPKWNVALNTYDEHHPNSALLCWASKAHERIQQALLEAKSYEDLLSRSPNIAYVCRQLVKYAMEKGKTPSDLIEAGITNLYRGVTQPLSDAYAKCFIATTSEERVADMFKGKKGETLKIAVDKLPQGTRLIYIGNDVDDAFFEEEYLLLPGTLHQKKNYTKYKPNRVFIHQLMMMPDITLQRYSGGDHVNGNELLRVGGYGSKAVDVLGMHIVYWRAIIGRPVEVFGRLIVPKDEEIAKAYLKDTYQIVQHQHKDILRYIPEYNDLVAADRNRHLMKRARKIESYNMYEALFDPNTKEIYTVHFRLSKPFFNHEYVASREAEVKAAIVEASDYNWSCHASHSFVADWMAKNKIEK